MISIALTGIILICTISAALAHAAGLGEYETPAARTAVWTVILIILLALAAIWLK